MINFIAGTVFGIVVATVGFTGIATMADKGLATTKQVVEQAAQK